MKGTFASTIHRKKVSGWIVPTSLTLALGAGLIHGTFSPMPDIPDAAVIAKPYPVISRSGSAPTEQAPQKTVGAVAPKLNNVETVVARAAGKAGVDPKLLLAIAKKESQLDPSANSRKSSAQGLFQFTNATWMRMVRLHGEKHGLKDLAEAIAIDSRGRVVVTDRSKRAAILKLRNNPKLASAMAADMLLDNKERVERRIGRGMTAAEIYITHFLGARQSVRFLRAYDRNPDIRADRLVPVAAESNSSIFFNEERALSVGEVRERLADDISSYMTGYAGLAVSRPET